MNIGPRRKSNILSLMYFMGKVPSTLWMCLTTGITPSGTTWLLGFLWILASHEVPEGFAEDLHQFWADKDAKEAGSYGE